MHVFSRQVSVSCECLGLRFTVVWSFSFKIEKRHRYFPRGASKMIYKISVFQLLFLFRPSQENQFISYIPRNAIKEYKKQFEGHDVLFRFIGSKRQCSSS